MSLSVDRCAPTGVCTDGYVTAGRPSDSDEPEPAVDAYMDRARPRELDRTDVDD
jgi:hypothetical protein